MWNPTWRILAASCRAACRSSASPASPPRASRLPCTTPTSPCAPLGTKCSSTAPPHVPRQPADAAADSRYQQLVNAFIALPDAPSVVAGHGRAVILTPDGEVLVLPTQEAVARLRTMP